MHVSQVYCACNNVMFDYTKHGKLGKQKIVGLLVENTKRTKSLTNALKFLKCKNKPWQKFPDVLYFV